MGHSFAIESVATVAMKIKDITEWSERWSTPLGTLEANAAVADDVLVDLSRWGTSIHTTLKHYRGGTVDQ
jgi:hypothetical protein